MTPKPNPKIVFFDIDETLYMNHSKHGDRGGVPESTKTALRLLKQKGIITAIATGRTIAVLPDAILSVVDECGMDLIVSANGQYVEYQGKPLASFPFAQQEIEQLSNTLQQHQISHALVARSGLFTALDNQHSQAALASLGLPFTYDPLAYQKHEIHQILGFYSADQDALVQSIIPNNIKIIRWHESGTDWLDKAGSKARGIQAALDHFGLTMHDAMAFGDAHNDVEMLQAVGFGVVMGNAEPEIKALAQYVCPRIEEDGIYRGLQELGVI
ncbi:Cof-type HAD-IIB family hydrolase [Kingella kingae]|uniref:Cof-type HAD-IIB family hydrolase n=2 Tax=Kingella kingae TaxID=504 RepID=UPI0003F728CE|nr:Cof-type HAD-IIB family hydrolase [Kingella kingae]MDK4535454.1 Cof-type HAD-IIB family hydrolase [Kingella kingae]MDK4538289.1 Cof-type HAD-IIB family hydrolase [Kingella kingae]MDK4546845.1 Cof-type HAD-IIB family hydrolase [Kingella kingae]MDK4555950.1 Cof-type HAD-IIB family hydrolase [Kingella kingae]MDK4597268.1 Cof-type HAD-IIB family hydrolase [Kingella kingae]